MDQYCICYSMYFCYCTHGCVCQLVNKENADDDDDDDDDSSSAVHESKAHIHEIVRSMT